MNTNIPAAIVYETRVQKINGEEIHVAGSRPGDTCNLSTGEVHVARMIDGIRYDTANASLIVGVGEYFGNSSYALCRLYRTTDRRFLYLLVLWMCDDVSVDIKAITSNDEPGVLTIAEKILPDKDVVAFLREWYCPGLLPIDDDFVKRWVERTLSADECQEALFALGNRHGTQADSSATTDA